MWRWFVELDAGRPVGFTAGPIGFAEIDAWARLRRIALDDWELSALRRMDQARLAMAGREDQVQPRSGRPMSAGLFDALFG